MGQLPIEVGVARGIGVVVIGGARHIYAIAKYLDYRIYYSSFDST